MMLVEQLPIIIPLILDAVISIIVGIIQAVIEALPEILKALVTALPPLLGAIWEAIKMVFKNLPKWFAQLFDGAFQSIKAVFSPVADWFSNLFDKAWNGIKNAFSSVGNFFAGIWNGIKNAFSAVGSWFKNIFSNAWNGIKNVFSGVGSFFTGIWNKIKNAFSAIGTKIGDAISGAVKKGINGVIGAAEKVINGFLNMINGAIGLINKIPGVNITKVKLVSFTRLAKGGVVDEPTPAVFGEDGAEAVVPLENNTEWMQKVAKSIHSFMIDATEQTGNPGVYGYAARSTNDQTVLSRILADFESLKNTLDSILDVLDLHIPSIRERMDYPMPAVVGVDQAADALKGLSEFVADVNCFLRHNQDLTLSFDKICWIRETFFDSLRRLLQKEAPPSC
jgi:hypothetical protein